MLNVLFQFFDHRDLVRVIGAVCQRWRSVSRKNLLWIDTRRFQGFKINNLAQAVDFSESLFRNGIYQGCAPFTKFSLPTGCSALLNSSFSRLYRVCPFIEELELPQATSAALLESAPNMAGAVATIRDRALKRIGKLTHLRKLDLHTHYGLTDEGIVRYLVQKPAALSLEAIILDLCVEISSDSIVALLNHCHKLRTLSSIGCNKCILSEQHLVSILKNLTSSASASASASASSISLQQSISNFSTTTTTTIITMPNDLFLPLEHLSVGLGTITDSTFDRFLSIVPRLKTLNLWSWTGATASMLSQLFRRLQHLESLTVHFTENTELTLPLIESASLRELFINTCVSCDRCLMKCPSLERLHIQSIRELSNLGLECPQLQALRIRSCKVFDTNLSSLISNMTRLQVLELVDCAGIHQLQMHSDSLESANLFMCGDLVELSIRGERMRSLTVESCMELLSAEVHCPNLESSHLFCIHQMMFPRLERLLLSSRRLSAFNLLRCINLVSLTLNCENLESLNLTDCRELRQLNLECPLLKKLMLHAPKIDLSSVETVDRLGLQCQNITMLSLASMPTLTDEALSRICTRWPTLQGLMLGGCNALVTPSISIPTLRGLHIGDCSSVSRISLSGCSTLNKLILKGCPNLVDETFEHLEHATPELKLLEVIQCRSLCRPFISNSSLNDAQFKLCASLLEPKLRCPNLRKIVFSVCDRLTGVRLTEAPHAQLLAIGARQLIVGEPHPQ